MTPFGIRNKLKSLLGRSDAPRSAPPPRAEVKKYPVTFTLPDGKSYTVDAKEGDSLALASGRGAWPIATGCADSTCATCQVEVLEGDGQLTPQTDHEAETKRNNQVPTDRRLGCQAGVLGVGVKVKIVNVFGENIA